MKERQTNWNYLLFFKYKSAHSFELSLQPRMFYLLEPSRVSSKILFKFHLMGCSWSPYRNPLTATTPPTLLLFLDYLSFLLPIKIQVQQAAMFISLVIVYPVTITKWDRVKDL